MVFPFEQFIESAKAAGRSRDFIEACVQYAEILQDKGYPVIFTIEHLSIMIGVKSNYLRAISADRKHQSLNSNSVNRESINSRYKYFKLSKKSGGYREIMAPQSDVKYVQKWLAINILSKYPLANSCIGFVPNLSIKTNAAIHESANTILKIDLLKFFDTINENRVFGVFAALGYNRNLAITMARLCTHKHKPDYWNSFSSADKNTLKKIIEDQIAVLPQGAPSSPVLANIIAKRMDERIEKLSKVLGFSYSRYADDMTFSIKNNAQLPSIKVIKKIIEDEGFFINSQKTRYVSKGSLQLVTGLTILNGVHVRKKYRKDLMRHIFFCRKYGVKNHLERQKEKFKNYNPINFHDWLYGSICFVNSIDPDYSVKLLVKFNKIDWEI